MKKVCTSSMTPVHGTPHCIVRVVLVEEVVLSLIINQAIRIIGPGCLWGEVELWAELFFVVISPIGGEGPRLTQSKDRLYSWSYSTLCRTVAGEIIPLPILILGLIQVNTVLTNLSLNIIGVSIVRLPNAPVSIGCLTLGFCPHPPTTVVL